MYHNIKHYEITSNKKNEQDQIQREFAHKAYLLSIETPK